MNETGQQRNFRLGSATVACSAIVDNRGAPGEWPLPTQNSVSAYQIDTCEGLEWGCEKTFTADAVTHVRGLDYAGAASTFS